MFSIHSELSSLLRDLWSSNLFRAQGKYEIIIAISFEIKHSSSFCYFCHFLIFFTHLPHFLQVSQSHRIVHQNVNCSYFLALRKVSNSSVVARKSSSFIYHYLFWHVQILLMSFSFRCHTTPSLGASVYSETCSGWFRRDISSQISKF